MKKLSFLIILICNSYMIAQNSNIIEKPTVDERVELLSIVFRLAESHEYSAENFKLYTDKINEHYSHFKDHKLINFVKEIRKKNGVSYDAVMKMAVHLDDELNPIVPFNDKIPEKRWGKENAYKFVELLKEFYADSNSEEFFENNKDLYSAASLKFLPVYENLDLAWYKNFYGKDPNEQFIIINGLGNGGGNFGPSVNLPDGRKNVYAVMGVWNTDSNGMVEFPVENYFPTLLHEFNHSFVNDMLDKNMKAFEVNAKKIYEVVEMEMRNGAYNSWETMINEALVRAAVIKYMKDHDFSEKRIALETMEQVNRGFIWIEDLVAEIENYDQNRDEFSTLEDYIPHLVVSYSTFAENIQQYVIKKDMEKPSLISISEFENGSKNVNPALEQISFNFDKPFTASNFIKPGDDMSKFPHFTNLSYSEDKKTVILNWDLEQNKEYEFVILGISSEKNNNGDYHVIFKTN